MAQKYLSSEFTDADSKLNITKPLGRFDSKPLDSTGLYATEADAKNYADQDSHAYVGQIVTVIPDNGDVQPYVINNEDGDIKRLIREQDVATVTNLGLIKLADSSEDSSPENKLSVSGTNIWPVKLDSADRAYVEGTAEFSGIIDEAKLLLSTPLRHNEAGTDVSDDFNVETSGVRGVYANDQYQLKSVGASSSSLPALPGGFTGAQLTRVAQSTPTIGRLISHTLLGVDLNTGNIHTASYFINYWSNHKIYKSYEGGTPTFDAIKLGDDTANTLTKTQYSGNAATATWASKSDTKLVTDASTNIATTQFVKDYVSAALLTGEW